jgi:hypothetical protein
MPIYSRDTRKTFDPAPEGLHQAVCCDVVDLGVVKNQWGEKLTVEFRWFLDCLNEKTGKMHMAVKRYTNSLNEKATLRHHLEAWRGRKFTAEELKQFDLENCLTTNCQIQIVHNIGDDGTVYGNVQTVVPAPKNAAKLAVPSEYVRAKDRAASGTQGRSVDEADESVPF